MITCNLIKKIFHLVSGTLYDEEKKFSLHYSKYTSHHIKTIVKDILYSIEVWTVEFSASLTMNVPLEREFTFSFPCIWYSD